MVVLSHQTESPTKRYAVPGLQLPLVLYSLGLPIALAVVLWRGIHPGSPAWEVWSFATVGYRQRTIWWEGWVMVRKFALIAVTVLLGTASPVVQLASAAFVTFVAAIMHSWQKPFAADALNWLEMGAQLVATTTVLVGMYVAASGQDAAGGVAVTTAVIVANVAFLVAVVGMIGVSARSICHGDDFVKSVRKRRRGSMLTQRHLSMAPQIRGSSFSEVANPINRIKE